MEISNPFVQSLREQMRVYSAYRAAAGAVMAHILGFDISQAWVGGLESQFSAGRQSGVEVQQDHNACLILEAADGYINSIMLDMHDGREDLDEAREDAAVLVTDTLDDWPGAVEVVAQALLKHGALSGADVARVVSESDV